SAAARAPWNRLHPTNHAITPPTAHPTKNQTIVIASIPQIYAKSSPNPTANFLNTAYSKPPPAHSRTIAQRSRHDIPSEPHCSERLSRHEAHSTHRLPHPRPDCGWHPCTPPEKRLRRASAADRYPPP